MSKDDRPAWAVRIQHEREARGWGKWDMARHLFSTVGIDPTPARLRSLARQITRWEKGNHFPRDWADPYAEVFDLPRHLLFPAREVSIAPVGTVEVSTAIPEVPLSALDNETEALELTRRVAATDVGEDTLTALEIAVDDLASAYPRTPPGELLARVRRHLTYVGKLLDARMTLAGRRRLVVVGGWLSLLAATCDIDLQQRDAAGARLRTAAAMARHADHPEILAWCQETEAWQAVIDGDYRRAVDLAQAAQRIAPRDGSAFIQANAQEGRAWARLAADGLTGAARETREALGRVERLMAPLSQPDRPEHHYRYDPAKSDAYTATTLAWVGDPAAEPYARGVLARLESGTNGPPRPRRAASARLDLALALLAADQPDEAAHTTMEAVTSGRLVPSNYWRAVEVITAVEALRVPEAAELHEAYWEICAPANSPPS